jgi:hypothetical protein
MIAVEEQVVLAIKEARSAWISDKSRERNQMILRTQWVAAELLLLGFL